MSSGSVERAGLKLLVIFFVCVVGVWQLPNTDSVT